jgi:hypothetical protein
MKSHNHKNLMLIVPSTEATNKGSKKRKVNNKERDGKATHQEEGKQETGKGGHGSAFSV